MASESIQIKRYPNRRYYAKNTSKYVSLSEIEEMIRHGKTVQVTDNQTGEDITRTVLTQLIIDRHPDKLTLFPADMLHLIVRANDLMADFLRDYFRHSLTYLNYLQKHGSAAKNLVNPIHWAKAWMDGIRGGEVEKPAPEAAESNGTAHLYERIAVLETRIQQLEEGKEENRDKQLS